VPVEIGAAQADHHNVKVKTITTAT